MPIPFTLNRTDYEAFEQRGVKLYGMRNTHALAKGGLDAGLCCIGVGSRGGCLALVAFVFLAPSGRDR